MEALRARPIKERLSKINDISGAINFTMFLTLFGQNMNSTDPLETLEQAFSIFDETGSGKIKKSDLEFLLKNIGDRYTQQQVRFSN